jgi:hypothetical protein
MPLRSKSKAPSSASIDQQISAFINSVHLGQILLNEKNGGKGDECFSRGKLSLEQVVRMCTAFQEVLAAPPEGVKGWTDFQQPPFDRAANIARLNKHALAASPRLPVNVMQAFLEKRLGGRDAQSVRAVANLCQQCIEVNKDGTLLQDLFRIYIGHGLKVSLTQLGMPSSDAELLVMGKELSAQTGACPFDTSPESWQITLRKIENWGEKYAGRRDKSTLARQLLDDPAVKPLIPALKKLPRKRLGILGHSMTMSFHWSSPGSWCETAAEVVRLVNPKLEYQGFQEGSFTPSRAVNTKLDKLLAYKPTEAIILLLLYTPEDRVALEIILGKLRGIGCTPFVVDDVRPWQGEAEYPRFPEVQAFEREACKKFGARFLGLYDLGRKVKGFEKWPCLDTVHMIPEGHIFYAKELLKIWAGKKA